MRYSSTRGGESTFSFSAAIAAGLAPDGGLFVPAHWPTAPKGGGTDPAQLAGELLAPFLADDVLGAALPAMAREAFDFPCPLTQLEDGAAPLFLLELFHGPTAAFKDFGARFLAACFARSRAAHAAPLTVLVATSGDTGGAVAAAFHRRPGIEVVVLFPEGGVSPLQQRQLTCWGENVRAFAVSGTFDDCQRLVKEAFRTPNFVPGRELTSANSINLGRLLPQTVYYALASLAVRARTGRDASFVVPSGNLGNVVACAWARRMGLPIAAIVLAHNANRTVPDFFAGEAYRPRASVATLATAMDVGDPSNMERLRHLHTDSAELRRAFRAVSIGDEAILQRIGEAHRRYGHALCPHTAAGAEAYARLDPAERDAGPWVLVATAHAAKFPEIVEPAIGAAVPLPPALAALAGRPTSCEPLRPELAALRRALAG